MKKLVSYFMQGLLIVVPVGLTFLVLGGALVAVDRWTRETVLPGGGFPGVGFLAMIFLITLVGFLGSDFFTRRMVQRFDRVLERLPVVKMLYGALKDLMNAFVGKERRFDRPVVVNLQGNVRALGFMTRDSLEHLGLPDDVAVYFPQSYNFAGQVLIVPRASVMPLVAQSADVMTFIVSGGISGR